eukprot:GHVR01027161.1.p1 GENE.GHVR01027161.1~~GHVR01027161.1.p1  ORF type:complete len:149 (+),score=17.10 GHVR01027161.1:50-448(+)
MPNIAGSKVVLVTSMDNRHPPENILNDDERSFWMSTGLYPQELIIEIADTTLNIQCVKFMSTHLKSVSIEYTQESTPTNFLSASQPAEFINRNGRPQNETINFTKPDTAKFVKFIISRGWSSFASIHKIFFE